MFKLKIINKIKKAIRSNKKLSIYYIFHPKSYHCFCCWRLKGETFTWALFIYKYNNIY